MSQIVKNNHPPSSIIDPHIEALIQLQALDPQWLQWMYLLWQRTGSKDDIIRVLEEQECPNPKVLLNTLLSHPLFTLAQECAKTDRQKALYHTLIDHHASLQSTPLLTYPTLTPSFFVDHFYSQLRPVLLTQWAQNWPAIQKWRPSFFKTHFGDIPIEVTTRRTQIEDFDIKANLLKESMLFGDFADKVDTETKETNDYYLIARNLFFKQDPRLHALFNDLDASDFCDVKRQETSIALWFGPAGTLTPLHHDTCNILFTQIWGEKHFILIPPNEQDLFKHSKSMYCSLNPEDQKLSPRQIECTLKPGQTLFIPAGWWHQVRSLSPSISVAMTHFYHNNFVDWYRPGSIVR